MTRFPKVVHYSAGRASQDMCKKPKASQRTDFQYARECSQAQEIGELLADKKSLEELTSGQRMWLETIPGWENYLPPHILN